MLEVKQYDAWAHTSCILAMLININKDTKKHGTTSFDAFNPYKKAEKKKKRVVSDAESKLAFAMMKKLWVDNAPERRLKKMTAEDFKSSKVSVKDRKKK